MSRPCAATLVAISSEGGVEPSADGAAIAIGLVPRIGWSAPGGAIAASLLDSAIPTHPRRIASSE